MSLSHTVWAPPGAALTCTGCGGDGGGGGGGGGGCGCVCKGEE